MINRTPPASRSLALAVTFALALMACPAHAASAPKPVAATQSPQAADKAAMIARAKALELPTPYVPPPGDPLELDAAGYAKIMCSAVFITGLDPDFAAENVGYFIAPYASRAKLGKPVIDRVNKTVSVKLPNGVVRTAKFVGDQGCVALPAGETDVKFKPVAVPRRVPDPAKQPWPMGDVLPRDPLPRSTPRSPRRRDWAPRSLPHGKGASSRSVTRMARACIPRWRAGRWARASRPRCSAC